MAACKGQTDSMHDSDSYFFQDVKRDLCICKEIYEHSIYMYVCMKGSNWFYAWFRQLLLKRDLCICKETYEYSIYVYGCMQGTKLILCMTQTVTFWDVKRDLHVCKETNEHSIYVYGCMQGTNWFYAWLRQLLLRMWKETYIYAKRPMNIVYMCMAAWKRQNWFYDSTNRSLVRRKFHELYLYHSNCHKKILYDSKFEY